MKAFTVDTPYPPIGSGVPRSVDKLHLSDVISYIMYHMGKGYKAGTWNADIDLTRDVGFLWERVLEMAYADRMAERIGEVELDGIIGSPDGYGYDKDIYDLNNNIIWVGNNDLILEEYKATWKSSKNVPTDNFRYMLQIKSYCQMLHLQTCVMHIIYLMGDYKGGGPQYRLCRIEFDQAELDSNWRVITDHARLLQRDREYQKMLRENASGTGEDI